MRNPQRALSIAAALLISLGLVALAYAAGGTLSVTVKGAGKALPGAVIKVRGTARFAQTAADGTARIEGLTAGDYVVRCEAKGFTAKQRKVSITDGQTTQLTCDLAAQKPAEAQEEAARNAAKAERKYAEAERMAAPAAEPEPKMALADDAAPAPRVRTRTASGKGMARRPKRKLRMAKPAAPRRGPPPRIAVDAPPPPEMNTEEYSATKEADFKSALHTPLSTFSIDVDTASYANARRFIEQQNRLPPQDAVRIEEFVNYFTYDYADPEGEHPFGIYTEVSTAPWNSERKLVHIGVQGKKVDTAALPPQNLVFLLDVSGSMNRANKLPLLKQAFRMLVDNLRPQDRVAIVVYAGAAGLVLPSTPGKQREKILDALDRLRAGGSTAGAAGIQLAYKVARENFQDGGNNRIILATDGDFNVGTSSEGDLVKLIEEKRKSGIFLTILGFGSGNYKDNKMEMLSNKGNGNAAYIDSVLEAKKVLVTEMGGTLLTIAKDVKIQVDFNPAKVKGYRLIGYENRAMADRDFRDDTKDAGELGAGHSVTVLYEIIPADSDEPLPGAGDAPASSYQKREISDAAKASPDMLTVRLRYKQPDGDTATEVAHPLPDGGVPLAKASADFRFSAAVATFAQVLRGSKYTKDVELKDVIELARGAEGNDSEGYRGGFVQLVRKAEAMMPRK